MFLKDPYGMNYRIKDIYPALEFYYKLMDKVDIRFYLTPNLHFQRKDIDLTIQWLKSFKPDDDIYRIWISNPSIQIGIEKIPGWQDLAEEHLPYNFVPIFTSLDGFYQAGNNILVIFTKRQIEVSLNQIKTSDEKITYLIKQKFHYSKNPDSFPKKFINDMTPFMDGQIEQYKELKRTEEESGVSQITRRIIQEYVNSLLIRNIEGNDLNTPLIQLNYDLFVERLQELILIPSSFDITKEDKERMYHVFVLAVLTGRIDGFEIKSNKESGRGRYDIALIPLVNTLTGVLIEIKKIDENLEPKDELEIASSQIIEKGYMHEFKQRNVGKVLKISLVYTGLKPNLEKELIETFN